MKRLLALVVIALSVVMMNGQSANAQELSVENQSINKLFSINVIDTLNFQEIVAVENDVSELENEQPKEEKPKPVEYTVVSGDNLSKIAKEFDVSWVRIWQKNTNLTNQDIINIGDKLVIPAQDEVLEDRPIYTPPEPVIAVRTAESSSGSTSTKPVVRSSYDNGGNTYGYGYCTWYVKNRRPDLPNGLGNANTWYSRASSYGLATSTTPRAGSVGTTTRGSLGHVVYVEAVHGDGTITISEMNYKGWNVTSSRTANANEFVYIK